MFTAIDSVPIGSAAMTFEGVTYAEVISNGLTPTGVPACPDRCYRRWHNFGRRLDILVT